MDKACCRLLLWISKEKTSVISYDAAFSLMRLGRIVVLYITI